MARSGPCNPSVRFLAPGSVEHQTPGEGEVFLSKDARQVEFGLASVRLVLGVGGDVIVIWTPIRPNFYSTGFCASVILMYSLWC